MYRRFIDFVVRRPWAVILATLLVTVALGSRLPTLEIDSDVESIIPRADDALANLHELEDTFGSPQIAMIAIMREDHPDGIYNPDTLRVIHELTEWLRKQRLFETETNADLRSLASVNNIVGEDDEMVVRPFMEIPPETAEDASALRRALEENGMYVGSLAATDGKGASIIVRVSEAGLDGTTAAYELLDAHVRQLADSGLPEAFHLAGRPIVESLFRRNIPAEGQRLMPWVLVIVALLLFVSFRTLRAVLIAISVVALTDVWMFGFLAAWGHPIYTITSILPVLIIAISVADCIHLLAKYYQAQEESPDADREEILRETMLDMGRPVFLTSLTTAIGFLSMTTSAIMPIRDFGIITAVGICAAFVLSLAYIPAVLAMLPLKPSPVRRRSPDARGQGSLTRLLTGMDALAGRRPSLTLAAFGVIAALGAYGVTRLHTDSSQVGQFRPSHSLRIADDVMNSHFAGGTLLDVIIDGGANDAIKNPEVLRRIDRFQTLIEKEALIGESFSIAETVKRMNKIMHGGDEEFSRIPETQDLVAQYLLLYSISGDPGDFDDLIDYDYRKAHIMAYLRSSGTSAARQMVQRSGEILSELFPAGDDLGVAYRLAGSAHVTASLEHHIVAGQLYSLAICVPVLTLLNWIMFRSLLLGVLTILPVLLAITLAYGGMGLIGVPADIATVMLGGMTLGIGIDFAIHYIHKYRTAREAGADHGHASRETALTAGRALFFNAIVLVGGFSVMLGARFYPQVKLGALVSVTMIVCYLATMSLFPAILTVSDNWARKRNRG